MQIVARLAAHPKLAALRSRAWAYRRQLDLDRAIRAAIAAPGPLPETLVAGLCSAWGDPALNAGDGYLRTCLAEAAKANGPILQCGSGLATLLLGIVAEHRGVHLWTLEHNAHAANTIRSWLMQYEITMAHVVVAPAELKHDCASYAIDVNHLPSRISLVTCEGSSALPGSARGVLPRIPGHLDENAVILIHNVKKRRDVEFAQQWAKGAGASFLCKGKHDPFVKITFHQRSATAEAERLNTAFARQHRRRA